MEQSQLLFSAEAALLVMMAVGILLLVLQRRQQREFAGLLKREIKRHDNEKGMYWAIISNLGEGLFVLDNDDRFDFVNPAAEKILGVSGNDLLGRRLNEVLDIRDSKKEPLCQDLSHCMVTEYWKRGQSHFFPQLLIQKGDGEYLPISLNVSPLSYEGAPASAVFAFRDVSGEAEVDKSKSEFVSVASHQMRTPLNSVRWILELLSKEDLGKLSKKQKEFVDEAYDSVLRMNKTLDDLLNVSRLEAGKVNAVLEPVDAREIFAEMIREVQYLSKAMNVKFVNELSESLPKVLADQDHLRQVVQNLVDNAVKYNVPGGKVTVSARVNDDEVIFSVADTGIGIPENQKSKVFEKFFRADNAVTLQTGGTGLGLYITKTMVEAMGGRIWYESQQNKGTTFYFSLHLPRRRTDREAGGDKKV